MSRVKERSGGNVRIEVVSTWGDYADDAEQQVVRAVAAGKVDLGWAGARVFDTMGVTSFQALQAPMLIDSYALEQAVRERHARPDAAGLDKVGVRASGSSATACASRSPSSTPARRGDWRGITFGTLKSQGQAQAIRALGATPMEVFRRSRNQALLDGSSGVRDGPARLRATAAARAPYVTANVTCGRRWTSCSPIPAA